MIENNLTSRKLKLLRHWHLSLLQSYDYDTMEYSMRLLETVTKITNFSEYIVSRVHSCNKITVINNRHYLTEPSVVPPSTISPHPVI